MEILFNTKLAVIFNSQSHLNLMESIKKDDLKSLHMLILDGTIRPNNTGTIKATDSLSFYENIDSFSNFSPIFDILLQDIQAASLIPLCWRDHILFKQGLLSIKELSPSDENSLNAYVVYRKKDSSPILQTALTLLRNLKEIYER